MIAECIVLPGLKEQTSEPIENSKTYFMRPFNIVLCLDMFGEV